MLRRKLLIRIGLLVACFVIGAAVAVYLLQETVPGIDRINRDALVLIDGAHTVTDCLDEIEDQTGLPPLRTPPGPVSPIERLAQTLGVLQDHPALRVPGSPQAGALERLNAMVPHLASLSTLPPEQRRADLAEMRGTARDLSRSLRAYVAQEQASFGSYVRGLVMGLTLAALVMVNIAVIVLLRTAQVVLKPVAELLEGSRVLASEHFEHRVRIDQADEFGELAHAYNLLAEQLQANEERKAEALRYLAVTLNHDLNNALATIELQLRLLDKQSGSDANLARYFRDIQGVLARMGRTVASLKDIRRVVLTSYADGQLMVDLERSVLPPPHPSTEAV